MNREQTTTTIHRHAATPNDHEVPAHVVRIDHRADVYHP
jgi:hypothetical protein